MTKTITWLRPYFRVKDEGFCVPMAIVTLVTRDTEFRVLTMGDLSVAITNTVPSKRQYWLRVNLWLVEFEFNWEKDV